VQSVCEILMRLASAKMSFESSPPSSSSTSCPFDDLFSGVVSVHSLVPELHKLKVGEEEEAVENNIAFEALSTQQKDVAGEGEQRSREKAAGDDQCPLHRVVILGSAEVGKSSLIRQLPTIANKAIYGGCPSADEESALCKVQLDHWTAQLEFLDPYPSSMWLGLVHGDQQAANKLKEVAASLLLVVYAVDDQLSLTHASRLLNCLKRMGMLGDRPAILVANKADLVRSRVVSAGEGKQLAERYSLTYLETSSGIGFNLDQLMVKMVADLQAGGSGVKPVKKSSIKEKVFGLVSKKYSK